MDLQYSFEHVWEILKHFRFHYEVSICSMFLLRDTYHRIKQRLDVMRDEKDLSQLLSLQKELEDEIEKFKSDVNLRRRNEGGFHEGN